MTESIEFKQLIDLAALPWLAAARDRLASAWSGGRFPHGVLIQGRPGLGAEGLALWLAELVLCERPLDRPCGSCASCLLFVAGNHPDLRRVSIEEDASYIKIEQVRELSEWAALKSYRGTRKVAILDPADRLYFNAFNALLKTLEEPPDNALLLLVATQPEKLPRTITSRCQRVQLRAPSTQVALDWLQAGEPRRDWPELLELGAGGPLRAVELSRAGMGEIGADMGGFLDAMQAGKGEVLRAAEAWSRDRPAERLVWLEHWAMRRARLAAGLNSDVVDNNRNASLPSGTTDPKIRACFDFIDRVRDARHLLQGSLNTQLLLEGVALAAAELVRAPARRGLRGREQGG